MVLVSFLAVQILPGLVIPCSMSMSLGSAVKFSMDITPSNKIKSAYEAFLEAFRTTVESAGKEVKFPDRPIHSCFSQSGDGTAVFERCLYLKG